MTHILKAATIIKKKNKKDAHQEIDLVSDTLRGEEFTVIEDFMLETFNHLHFYLNTLTCFLKNLLGAHRAKVILLYITPLSGFHQM